MNIEELHELIEQKAGDLSDAEINIEVKTVQNVDRLIELLSKVLKIDNLIITVNEEVSGSFISKFINMAPKPKIKELTFPEIKLTHANWQIFFKGLSGFKGLKSFKLENSNLDYSNDLQYLGEYIAGNPTLKDINLCDNEKNRDKTFLSGSDAKKLLGYLQTNTNLISIKYGHPYDDFFNANLSKEIKQKLDANASENASKVENKKIIAESVARLNNDTYLPNVRENLGQFIIASINDSLLKGTKNENEIQSDIYGLPLSIKRLRMELARLQVSLDEAMQDEEFNQSSQADKIQSLGKYYHTQYCLIDALDKMYQQELEASPHDKPILHNLREDFLKQWKAVAITEDINEKNTKMSHLIERMFQNCEQASKEVTDKTSSALIKNVLLILSAIITVGISLGIYIAVTKQSRAERGTFFFKDAELSKNKIDEVKESLQEVKQNLLI